MTNYEKSNAYTAVDTKAKLTKQYYKDLLLTSENLVARQRASQRLINYLCKYFGIERAVVRVVDRKQPHEVGTRGKLITKTLGLYHPTSQVITMYNRTAIKRKVVNIKTFTDILLHEFIHHYDSCYLKLTDSIHTVGFYKRITDLQEKLS